MTVWLRHRLPIVVTLLSLVSLASAAAAAPSPSAGLIALRFLFLDETGGAYSLKTSKGYVELGDVPCFVGEPVMVAVDERLELFREVLDSTNNDRKPRRLKVASVSPPAGMLGALVVVTPVANAGSNAGTSCSLEYFDSSPEAFPAKSIRVVNLAKMPVAARFSSSQVITAPGASQIVQPEIDGRNRVRTKAAVQTPAGWLMLYDSLTIVRPRQRVTAVCVFSPNGMRQAYDIDELARIDAPPPGHFWITYTEVL